MIRARKKKLLDFDGEMLYQGKDDDQWIVLTKTINSIRVYFGREGDIINGGEVDEEVAKESKKFSIDDETRRSSTISTKSLPVNENPDPVSSDKDSSLKVPENTPSEVSDNKEVDDKKSTTSKVKLTNKALRSSFRKIVRPIFKRNNSIKDEDGSIEESSASVSRRGSWLSTKSASTKNLTIAARESENDTSQKDEVQKRWKKVLGVSKAIGR